MSQAQPRTETDIEPLFMDAAEVGALLRLKKSRVYELEAMGALPSLRLGRRILFSRRGILAMEQAAIDQAMSRQSVNQTLV